MSFDLAAFKKEWRKLADMVGVDPVEGATSYQVVAWKAACEKARKRAAQTDWWKDSLIWFDPGWCPSEVEQDCYTRLFWQAWQHEIKIMSSRAARHADKAVLKPLRAVAQL